MTRLHALDAMRSSTTPEQAAERLGMSVAELRDYAYSKNLAAAYLRLERGGRPPDKPHPTFVDMTGQRVDRVVVEKRAQNGVTGNAQWVCRCDCGARVTYEGIQLRAALKRGHNVCCRACRPKRPGTYARKGASC